MEGHNISVSTDVTGALDLTMEVSSSNCYVADAQRESMSPQQFTATYDQARDFIREAGRSTIDAELEKKRHAYRVAGVTVEDITKLTDRFWAFYLGGKSPYYFASFLTVTSLTFRIQVDAPSTSQHAPSSQSTKTFAWAP